jgi:hypothetical protein
MDGGDRVLGNGGIKFLSAEMPREQILEEMRQDSANQICIPGKQTDVVRWVPREAKPQLRHEAKVYHIQQT